MVAAGDWTMAEFASAEDTAGQKSAPATDRGPAILDVARISEHCTVLGPGVRAVIWVQGCPLRCKGCVAPEALEFGGGTPFPIGELATSLAALPHLEGVTFSGGEPFAQAPALVALVDEVRRLRPELSFLSYSGFTLERLRRGSDAQRALLARLDVLIDGQFIDARHTDLMWRGSDNQRVHLLSDRYLDLQTNLDRRGHHMEFEVDDDGSISWMGIPPRGFRDSLPVAFAGLGITLEQETDQ